jgi:hypothetical protein
MDYAAQIQAVKDAQAQVNTLKAAAIATDAANVEAQRKLMMAHVALDAATKTLHESIGV